MTPRILTNPPAPGTRKVFNSDGTYFKRATGILEGYCHCGCGGRTKQYPKAYVNRGIKKGDFAKFIVGHAGRRGKPSIPVSERFWENVQFRKPDQCWEWKGSTVSAGYGRIMERKHGMLAHRKAYELAKGKIPEGLVVRHTCDNPSCCNPRHLLVGTHKDNSQDSVERGRNAKGEGQGNAKLSDRIVKELRKRHAGGVSISQLSREYMVARSTIRNSIKGKTWSHVS